MRRRSSGASTPASIVGAGDRESPRCVAHRSSSSLGCRRRGDGREPRRASVMRNPLYLPPVGGGTQRTEPAAPMARSTASRYRRSRTTAGIRAILAIERAETRRPRRWRGARSRVGGAARGLQRARPRRACACGMTVSAKAWASFRFVSAPMKALCTASKSPRQRARRRQARQLERRQLEPGMRGVEAGLRAARRGRDQILAAVGQHAIDAHLAERAHHAPPSPRRAARLPTCGP